MLSVRFYLAVASGLCEYNTGLFISLSGISDPCDTVAGMVTPKGNMSTEGEFLSYLTGARYVQPW
jgi:hypothetical protein